MAAEGDADRREGRPPCGVGIWSRLLGMPLIWNSVFLGVVRFGVVHLGGPLGWSMDWGSVFCPSP